MTEDDSFSCNICHKEFKSEFAVAGHIGRVHHTKITDSEPSVEPSNTLAPSHSHSPSPQLSPREPLAPSPQLSPQRALKGSKAQPVEISPISEVAISKESVKYKAPEMRQEPEPNLTEKSNANYGKYFILFFIGMVAFILWVTREKWVSNIFNLSKTESEEEDIPFGDTLRKDIASRVVYVTKR